MGYTAEDRAAVLAEHAAKKARQAQEEAEKKNATEMDISQLESFPNHKFSLYTGERLDDMVDSIRNYGIITPLIVWHTDNRYIILSGHNRKNAAYLAGLEKVPVIIIENITAEEAELYVSETNLRQRSFTDLSYSERAYCLAAHYENLKRQGKRNELLDKIKNAEFADSDAENSEGGTNAPEQKSREKTRDKIGDIYNLSPKAISEYVRVATINKELMTMLDEGNLPFKSAYQLSFVQEQETQELIAAVVKGKGKKVNPAQAAELRAYWEAHKALDEETIINILDGKKTAKPKQKGAVIKPKILYKYFPVGTPMNDIINKIVQLLEADKEKERGEEDNVEI